MKYKVVFRGKFNSDIDQKEILENLSELFDESVDGVHQKFFSAQGKDIVLIAGLSNADATEYKEALQEAGVEVEIDLDFDMESFSELDANILSQPKKSGVSSDSNVENTSSPTESIARSQHQNIRQKFLETQEFTLMKNEDDAPTIEENRVAKLKKLTRKSDDYIEIDDRDQIVEPPLFNSGVRIGRLRFLCRILFAFAILMTCLNVLPLYLKDYMGTASYIPSFILVFLAFMFVIMVISQRFCDIDNLTIGAMAFVIVILGTLMISFFINDYYALSDAKVAFAKQFLQNNSMNHNFFSMQKSLNTYLVEASQPHLLQKLDSIIKWIVYVCVFGGAILLFALSGIEGNNQFGAPSDSPNFKSFAIGFVSFLCLLYSVAYPYSSKEHRAEHKLYQIELYEYLGLLKPLPDELETVYKDYLHKTQQKLGN